MVVKIKTFPTKDGGLIGLIKSRPHFEKGKSGRTGCKGIVERRYFPTNFWHLSRDLEKL
jgi:hypothetical protein